MRDNTVVIAAVGDSLGHKRAGDDGNPFEHVMGTLCDADLRFMNLETVLTGEKEPVAQKWIHIRTEPSAVRFLQEAGIDVVNVAHNHILDYGAKGFNDTLDCLIKAGISPIGAGRFPDSTVQPAIFYRNGLKVAFVGFFTYPISKPGEECLIADIDDPDKTFQFVRDLGASCDVLVVSLHWGDEHVIHPSPEQIEFAHGLIDSGAHLVLGHHSHCVQGLERYKKGLIAYSLGNFNFWQPDVDTRWFNRLSIILRVRLTRFGVSDYELTPVWIDESYSPIIIQDESTRRRAHEYFDRLCHDIADGSINWTAWYEELGWTYVSQTLKSFAVTIPKYGFVRLKKLLWWLTWGHARRAMAGAIRARIGRKTPYHYCLAPISLDAREEVILPVAGMGYCCDKGPSFLSSLTEGER